MENDSFEVQYSIYPNGKLREYVVYRDGVAFGPILTFFKSGKLKSSELCYSGVGVGTSLFWIDVGSKFYELYKSPGYADKTYDRQYVIEYVSLMQAGIQQAGNRRWSSHSEIQSQEDFDHSGGIVVPQLIDQDAEADCEQVGSRPARKDFARWPNGNFAYLGYKDYRGRRFGAHVAFWDNGMVRSISDWAFDGVIGTRCCFCRKGELLAEQNFARDGWRNGNWVTRFFSWRGDDVAISEIEVFQNNQRLFSLQNPVLKSAFEDVAFNRYVDPLLNCAKEYSWDIDSRDWKELGPVDFSRF